MIEYVFRPIDKWPREFTKSRRRTSPFALPFERVVRDLAIEVQRHGARRVVIELALEREAIRRDGLPYATATPAHPGVIISFETKHGPVKMPCDAFADWKDNLRAIGITLEHLRGVDRYGVSQHGEQYRGWTALPPAPSDARMTFEQAAEEIAKYAPFIGVDWIRSDAEAFKNALRIARTKTHPDKDGGDDEAFKRVEAAAEILGTHHGVAA